jgi:tRNA A37 threonylcarbamoyladenosine synthetase subunit TsaC/SUA5/YrdC
MTSIKSQSEHLDAPGMGNHLDYVERASKALRAGQVVVIPTDTVYGLAAALDRPEAISHLYAIKNRPLEKAIPVLLSDASQVHQVAADLPGQRSIPRILLLARSADAGSPCAAPFAAPRHVNF